MLGGAVFPFQYQNGDRESICQDASVVNAGIPADKVGEEIKSQETPLPIFEATLIGELYAGKKATLFSWYPVARFLVFSSSNLSMLFH